MALFHRDETKKSTVSSDLTPSVLSGEDTVEEWLNHPTGGVVFREMLQKAGQNEKVLRIVRKVSMERLVEMSRGQFTQEMLDDMIHRANGGEASSTTESEAVSVSQTTSEQKEGPNVELKSETAAQNTQEFPSQAATQPVVSTPEKKEINDESQASVATDVKPVVSGPWQEKITPDRFADKTVIVTGAGSGIGRATALRVAREGGRVIAVDISKDRLDELKREIANGDIVCVTADITKDEDIAAIMKEAGMTIDALANVAGVMDNMTPLHEMSDAVWDKVMGVNLVGMMKLSRAVLPTMLNKKRGTIVNVGSEASMKASAAGTAYTTSKHAVVGLSKSMAFMYGPSGIRTNVVAPGAVLTNIEATYDSELGSERVNTILPTATDAAESPELAAAITFLLSDDSVNINGAILPSDGGWSVQ